jgi:hypothetical protein
MSNLFKSILRELSNKELLEVMAKCGAVVDDMQTTYNIKRVFYKLSKVAESVLNNRMDKEG